jgi:hypothetical protein
MLGPLNKLPTLPLHVHRVMVIYLHLVTCSEEDYGPETFTWPADHSDQTLTERKLSTNCNVNRMET